MVAALCVAASVRRLAVAIAPAHFDVRVLLEHLGRGDASQSFVEIEQAARADRRAEWFAALFDALEHRGAARTALVNEQLTEIDDVLQRFARVPRVCASLCTSAGFLLAALSIRSSLDSPEVLAEATRAAALRDAVTSAIDIAAIGICGTAFCIAVHVTARRAWRASHADIDRLVERLEAAARPLP